MSTSSSISETGNGLTVAIASQYEYQRDWLAFACWYSIHKMLPDADIALLLPKTQDVIKLARCFRWAERAHVKKLRRMNNRPLLVVNDDVIAVRDLKLPNESCRSEDGSVSLLYEKTAESLPINFKLCSDCKGDDYTAFVKVGDECGKYKRNDQLVVPPFFSHYKLDLTINESLVVDLWQKMLRPYTELVNL